MLRNEMYAMSATLYDVCHEKTDLKVFVVIPKEGLAGTQILRSAFL